MSAYLDELRAITDAREQFNELTRALHESRGVPPEVPIVAVTGDEEIEQHAAVGEALLAREEAFRAKFYIDGVDPHSIR